MKNRNLLFPIFLVIVPHTLLFIYWIYDIDEKMLSYLFPLLIETVIGISGGFYALKLIRKHQADLTKYFKKMIIAILIAVAFILVGGVIGNQYFFEGNIMGGILGTIVLFGFWVTLAENSIDRKILFFVNPLNYAVLIVIALLIGTAFGPSGPPLL